MADDYKRPGWYPDPDGTPGERWWNGSGWSDSRRGGAAPAVASVVYSADNPAPDRPNPYASRSPGAVGSSAPVAAFTINAQQNRPAFIGFILGLVSVFGLSIAGPVAIVFSIVGIVTSRRLAASGSNASSALVLALIGLVTGLIATAIFLVAAAAFIASFTFDYTP